MKRRCRCPDTRSRGARRPTLCRGAALAALLLALLVWGPRGLWAGPIEITDDRGRGVRLAAPARRVIALYGAYNEMLAGMGLLDLVVGRTKADTEPPEIRSKPSIGTHMRPNVEMVVGLAPDLIIQDAGRREGLGPVEQLEARGLPVAVFHPRSFSEMFSVIQRLGVLTGEAAKARGLIEALEARLAAVAQRLKNIPARPRVFFEVRYPNLLGAGAGSIVGDIITRAGGVNVLAADKKMVRLDMEALIRLNPEVYLVQRGPMNRNPAEPAARPHFGMLPAVQAGRVLMVEEQMYSRPSPRAVGAVEELAGFLHPAAPAGQDQ